ncbi:probable receptor-like serine/threonine-protein kinase At4g34500 [Glycine max]|uniref:probable receptor-like serine/threonine-protein kinase At4g34500 n=1 Tax=Glycine max TaxID=3847 RepID=UPI0003DE9B12|nr:probable receptor-like serine/threonine-protein kinase At4g34500 [Glycine max]|eukprot:XP_006582738.1 probable receptor-like serine/threonine-protein kinase At4g34500 [Glycine max]
MGPVKVTLEMHVAGGKNLKFFCEIASLTILLLIFFLCFHKKRNLAAKHSSGSIPLVSKEITMVKASDPKKMEEAEVKVEIGGAQHHRSSELVLMEDLDIGWGRWYTIWEVELVTRGFVEGNIIGEGGYAVVYRGVLHDASVVAVKNLLNNKKDKSNELKVVLQSELGLTHGSDKVLLGGFFVGC